MDLTDTADRAWVDFLLGTLKRRRRRALEERLFTEEDAVDRLAAVEDDLVDAYVRGELGVRDCKRFEQRYLRTPARREKVAFARALARKTGDAGPARDAEDEADRVGFRSRRLVFFPAGTWLPAAAALLLAVVFAGLWWMERERRPGLGSGGEIEMILRGGPTRGPGSAPELARPRPGNVVCFVLQPDTGVPPGLRCRARLERAEDGFVTVLSLPDVPVRVRDGVRVAEVPVPGDLLRAGDHVITLEGVDGEGRLTRLGSFSFRIASRSALRASAPQLRF